MHSVKNLSAAKIKEITKLHQKKYRDELKLFIAEGNKAFEEILNADIEIISVYALETFKPKHHYENIKIISQSEMKKISTTASVCEVLVIGRQKIYQQNELKGRKLILLDEISDPGNLGTIIRSAAAFNIDGIILFGNTIELYSPKVIRACAGNFFKTPVISIKTIPELKRLFPDYTFISTALKKDNNITFKEAKQISKSIIMFGSEAQGLNEKLIDLAEKNIVLNMKKNVESLNLSVSASIVMYELF